MNNQLWQLQIAIVGINPEIPSVSGELDGDSVNDFQYNRFGLVQEGGTHFQPLSVYLEHKASFHDELK